MTELHQQGASIANVMVARTAITPAAITLRVEHDCILTMGTLHSGRFQHRPARNYQFRPYGSRLFGRDAGRVGMVDFDIALQFAFGKGSHIITSLAATMGGGTIAPDWTISNPRTKAAVLVEAAHPIDMAVLPADAGRNSEPLARPAVPE